MSYEIIYSRNFIKTNKGYLMLTLSGSNNDSTWYYGRWRRSRDWCIFWQEKFSRFVKQEEMMDFLNATYKDNEYCDFAQWNGHRIGTKQDIIKFYEDGFKKAKTIEEYIKSGKYNYTSGGKGIITHLKVFIMHYNESEKDYDKRWYKTDEKTIKTTQELVDAIEELKDKVNHKTSWLEIKFNEQEKITCSTQTEIKGKCIIKKGNKYYCGQSNYYINLTCDKKNAQIFNSYEEAKEINNKLYGCRIVNYNENQKEIVKNYAVKIKGYGYFHRFNAHSFSYSGYRKFAMEEKRARQVLEKLKQQYYWMETDFELVKIEEV